MRIYGLFAFYVVTPDPAFQTRTVCKHSVLRLKSRISYLSMSSFSSQTAVALFEKAVRLSKNILMFFLDQSDRAHSKEKLQL